MNQKIDSWDHSEDNGAVMTTPQRSTRRSVNPPEGDENPEQEKRHTHNLAEVESILDEIENLVSKKSKKQEDTAKPTPVFDEHDQREMNSVDETKNSEEDLGRLEEELQSAIASELEKSPESAGDGRDEALIERAIPEDEISKLAEVFEEAEASRSGTEGIRESRESDDFSALETTLETGDDTLPENEDVAQGIINKRWESKILALLSRPMQGLSPTGRLAVNIVAITLALWVPIIWLLVLSGGLSAKGPDSTTGLTSGLAPETQEQSVSGSRGDAKNGL